MSDSPTSQSVKQPKKIGRPKKSDPWKRRHPVIRLPDLRKELNTAVDFIMSYEDEIFHTAEDKDCHNMACQQVASRIDETLVVLFNLKLAVLYQYKNPIHRLL
jgi:hypothetical protein